MAQDRSQDRPTDAPAAYRTARRPGQTGEASEQRPGPSPLSNNATGPHAPYEADDPEGLAAAKHVRETPAAPARETPSRKKGLLSENFAVLGKDS
jgi:hypothetical protein